MSRKFTQSVLLLIAVLAFSQQLFGQTANAGPNQNRCGINTATLAGNAPNATSNGVWSVVSGTGTFANSTVNNTVFTATGTSIPSNSTTSVVLRWTIANPPLVISQIYPDGGSTGATFNRDFVEIHNRSNAAVSLANVSLQYASGTGTFASAQALSGSIPAGGYLLIACGTVGATGVALPTPNVTANLINLSATAGRVALVAQTGALNCGSAATTCTTAQTNLIYDMVAYGSNNGLASEGALSAVPTNFQTARRNPVATACDDTNNNASDFTIGAASLADIKTSASTPQICTLTNSSDVTITFTNISTATTVTENSGTANDGTIACGASATISATGAGSSYSWASTPAGFTASTQNITVTPAVTTSYICTITLSGCSVTTTSRTINVNPITTATTVTETSGLTPNDGTICSGASATITASGGTNYLWGANANNAATASITVAPTITTTYICTVSDANGCTNTVSRTITVFNNPTINTTVSESSGGTANDGLLCSGASGSMTATGGNTYLWSPSTFLSSANIANPNVTAITTTTTYTVTGTSTQGCTNTATRTLTVIPPPNISINVTENSGVPNDATVCSGASATLVASGGLTYIWSPAASLNVTNGSTVVATPSVTTTYFVTATDANLCSATRSQVLSVPLGNPLTVTETSGTPNDGFICPGGAATITASGGATYQWSANANSAFTSSVTVSPTSPTNVYSCTITDAVGCASIVMTTINVDIIPAAINLTETSGTANDGNICLGGNATLTATGGGTYVWSSAPAGLSSVATSITVTPTITTTYVITVTNPATGCSATASRRLTLVNLPSAVTTVTETSGTPNNNTICVGGAANLSVPNVAGNLYNWTSLPAGFTSQASSISVTPTVTTTYNVTVTNPSGCTAANQVTITVQNPNTNITITETSGVVNNDAIVCQGGTATLSVPAGQGTYAWVSPYGETSSTETFVVAPTITTTYTLTVTTSNGCTAVRQAVVTVTDPPAINFTVTEDSGTPNDAVICQGTSAVLAVFDAYDAYTWRSNPTGLIAAQSAVTVTPTVTTTYLLTVTNDGCQSVSSFVVTVLPRPSSPISVTETSGTANDGRVCFGTPTTLTISGGVNYLWDANAGGVATASVTIAPTATTTYSCTVTGANGCVGVSNFTVTVTPTVNINITENSGGNPNDGIICAGGATTLTASGANQYVWRSNPAGTNASTAAISVAPTITTTYLLTATDNATGCVATIARTIEVLVVPPQTIDIAEFSGTANDGNICAGASVNLFGPANGVAYQWASVPAGLNSTLSSVVVSPSVATTYNVTVTNSFGCSAVASRLISVNPVITVTENSGTANDGRVCTGTNVTLNATTPNAVSYSWTSIPAGFTSNLASITVTPTATTIYTVEVNNNNGCIGTNSFTVNVLNGVQTLENAGIQNDRVICAGNEAVLFLPSGLGYLWESVPAGLTSTASSITVTPTVTTTYNVAITGSGCTTTTATSTVTIAPSNLTVVENSGTANDAVICSGSTAVINAPAGQVGYQWSSVPAGFSAATSSITVTPTENTVYTVTISNIAGCTSVSSQNITVLGPGSLYLILTENSGSPNDDKLCFGTSGTLEANIQTPFALNATYTWSPTTALNPTTGTIVTASPTITTTYNVTVNAAGCILTGAKTIEVIPRPAPLIVVTESSGVSVNDNTVCIGDVATLTASGGVTYQWDSEGGGSATSDVINVSPTATTTYTVTVTNANGCTAVRSVTINVPTVNSAINVTETSGTPNDGNICRVQGATAVLTANPNTGGTFLWTSLPAGLVASTASITVTPTVSTTYNLAFKSNANGCITNVARDIVLVDVPSTALTVNEVSGTPRDGIVCQGTSVQLEVPDGALTYTWTSNPPGVVGNTNQVITTPNATTTVTVTASSVGCQSSSSTVLNVLALPSATFTATRNNLAVPNGGSICLGDNLIISVPTGAASYSWDSSPSGLASASNSITVAPTQFTAYNVTVTSANQNACQNFNSFTVNVINPPIGAITVTDNSGSVANDGNICVGSNVSLAAPTGIGFSYNWSSNPAGFTANTQTVTPSPTITTTYTVTVTSSGCTNITSRTITVDPVPSSTTTVTETSGLNPNDAIICRGDAATITAAAAPQNATFSYFWSSPDGFTATTQSITVSPTATTTYSLAVTNDNTGCIANTTRVITVNNLPNNTITVTETSGAPNDGQTCYIGTGAGASVTIAAPSGATYIWESTPAGAALPTTATIVVAPTVSTTYNVTMTQNGCSNTATQFVNVGAFPVATVAVTENSGAASNDGNVCAGTVVSLATIAGQGAYSWSSNPVGTVGITANINATPTTLTTYTVTVTTPGGCSAIGSTQVTVTNTILGTIEVAELSGVQNDGNVCANTPVVLTALGMATGGPVTYNWSSVPSGTTGAVSVLNVNPTVTTTYIVTATPSNGSGCPATQSITVNVLQARAICKAATLKLNTPSVTLSVADINNNSIGGIITIDKTTFTCFNTGLNQVKLKVSSGVCVDSCFANVTISDGPGCNPIINPLAQDEAKITDPCQCTGGVPTNLKDGKFTEVVTVDSAFAGQIWAIKNVDGLFKDVNLTMPYLVGDLLTGTLIAPHNNYARFTLNGFHKDSVGYSIEVWRLDANGVGVPGSALTTSNRCFYPTPVYRPNLPLVVPVGAAPISINSIDINAGNNVGALVTNSINGGANTSIFNPATLGVGTHTITTTYSYGNATSSRTGQLLNAPICASRITQQIVVNNTLPPMACKSLVNYTLERDCSAPVLAGDFLLGAPKGFGGYTVTIMDGNTIIPQINATHVNKNLTVKVTDLTGNSCWSTMLVEDKTAPIVDCSLKKIFYCEDNVKLNLGGVPIKATPSNAGIFTLPNVQECSKVDTTFYDEGVYQGCSSESVFAGKRFFTVRDLYGNTATCAVDFEVRRRYLEDIAIPGDITISCENVKGGAASVTLAQAGQPSIKGKRLSDVSFCGFGATYTDAVVNTCGNGFDIQREWVIGNSCSAATRRQIQYISVKDLVKPVVNVSAIDATINADITSVNCNLGSMGLPMPVITDNCDPNPTLNITVRNQNGAIVNTGAVVSNLPVGSYIVFYAATDNCGNVGIATRGLAVRDVSAPHPVCRTNVEVSLSRSNTDVINATSLDGGSTDNCCLDVNRFEVARMNGTTVGTYAPTLQVRCSDRDVMVAFRIWDCNGNNNVCMTNVRVSDKLPPVAIPENITVSCGSDATAIAWLDEHPLKKLDKAPTSSNPGYYDHEGGDPTCTVNAVVSRKIDSLDNCGNGYYAYEWTVTDQSGNRTVVQQRYVSSNNSVFSVIFPKDTVIVLNGQCDSVGTSIQITGDAKVNVAANACPVISKSYFDQAIKLSNDSVCFMITRVWRVANLCRPMPAAGVPLVPHITSRDVTVNSNNINNGYFEYHQRIRVIDLAPPTITTITPVIVEPVDKECKSRVTIQAIEAKDCSGQNINQNFTLAKTDGTIVSVGTNNLPATFDISAKDFGDYRVVYQVSDDCGNATTASQIFKVKDVLKPTPVCHDNIVVDLGNSGLAMVPATVFDAGSFDNCSKNLKFRIRVLTDSSLIVNDTVKVNPDTLPSMYTFRCPPKGIPTGTSVQWAVQLWVGDEAGNWDFCETSADVQDNMLICNYEPNEMRPLEVVVKTEKGKEVENVKVQLQGSTSAANFTSKIGKVQFNNLPSTGSYQVIPEKTEQPLNGVSTYDLVMISKHILGVQPFTSPYQFIAADANKNGAVTTADVVELRKMILALQNDFSKNKSWRFVDQSFQFPTGVNPLSVPFPEKSSLIGLLPNQTVNFIGVKIGDVNASASVARSATTSFFTTDDKSLNKDEVFTARFENMDALDGYQFTFEYDKNSLELIDIQGNKDGFGVVENGLLTVSQVLTDGSDASFGLTFRARQSAQLSDAIRLTTNILTPEAYDKAGNIQNTALKFNNKTRAKFELYQNQPNPFQNSTMISFSLPESGTAVLKVTDISGKVVKVIRGEYPKGFNQIAVDKADLGTSGLYYYTLESANQTATKKMIIVE
jgi:hypothetical protein